MRSTFSRSIIGLFSLAIGLGVVSARADKVTMWVNAPLAQGPTAPIYDELKAFEQATGHTVELQAVPHMEFEKRLFVALGGGAGPDVMALDIAWIPSFADAGLLKDITEKTKPVAASYQPGPLAAGRFEGKQYALPLYTNNVALYVNDEMLAQAGVKSPPKTWAEFKAAAKAMRALGPDKYGLSLGGAGFGAFQLYSFIWQNGGDMIDEKGAVKIGDPAAVEAMAFLAGIFTEDKAAPDTVLTALSWDEVHAPFIQGRAGMLISGDWAIGAIKRGAPNLKFTIVPLPAGKSAATVIGGFNIAVNDKAKSPAAVDLALWLTGPRSTAAMKRYSRIGAQTAAVSAAEIAALAPEMRPFMEQAPAGRPRPAVAAWAEIHANITGPAWDAVIRGRATPAQAMQGAADAIKAKLK